MISILFYGDSNTYGFDPRGFAGGRYPEGVRWTSQLAQKSEGRWQISNGGLNGRMIPQTSWQMKHFLEMLEDEKSGLLSVMLGTNDLLNALEPSADRIAARMEDFIRNVQDSTKGTGLRILLVSPPWIDTPDAGPACCAESRKLAGPYARVAEKLHLSFANAAEAHPQLAFDGIHLSEEGHTAFARWMEGVLTKL